MPTCGANEVYSWCGTSCEEECSKSDMFRPCILKCVEGCFCQDGYVRDDNGDCILREDCPTTSSPTCDGENFEYTLCGSYCPPSCDNLFDFIICPSVCIEGCFCKTGYVLNTNGECILPNECPIKSTEIPTGCDTIKCDDSTETCAEDSDGNGNAGCVTLGNNCDNCFKYVNPSGYNLPCYQCPDGINYFGACDGCIWQLDWWGKAICRDTRQECPELTTEEPLSTETTIYFEEECCNPYKVQWMESNWMCREGCACCPDGSYVPSWGDAETFTCRNGDILKAGDDDFGELCDDLTREPESTYGMSLIMIILFVFYMMADNNFVYLYIYIEENVAIMNITMGVVALVLKYVVRLALSLQRRMCTWMFL